MYEEANRTIRYLKSSGTLNLESMEKLEGRIVKLYHVLEKGITHPKRKSIFGVNVAIELEKLILEYEKKYNNKTCQIEFAQSVLQKYEEIKKENVIGEGYYEEKHVTRDEIKKSASDDFKVFTNNRHSIREFTEEEVTREKITQIIKDAQNAPSSCNTQSIRVHAVQGNFVDKVLSLQNGNRGFGQNIKTLLILTSDLSVYNGINERNLSLIDGGIFALSILYSIHYHQLGAITLNWCVNTKTDLKLRDIVNIKNNEEVFLMIGLGCLPEAVKIPISKRRNVEEVLSFID